MNPTPTSRIPRLARAGLALAALLMLLPAPGYADTLNLEDDTYTNSRRSTRNYGSRSIIRIRDGRNEGFFKFDLSALGTAIGDDITKATLRLWIKRVRDEGAIDIHLVTEAWTEGTTTFGSAPDIVAAPFVAAFPILDGAERVWTLIDITPVVQGWLDGVPDGFPNHGIAILPTAGSDIYIELDSKESGRNQVELEVSNVPPASVGTVGGPMGGQLIGGGTSADPLINDGDQVIGMFHGQPEDIGVVNQIGVPMPGEGSVTDLHVHLDGDPGTDDKYTFTVFNNGGVTDVKCDIEDDETKCEDKENAACFLEGDLIAIEVVPTGTPTVRAMTWSAVFTPEDFAVFTPEDCAP